MTPTNFYITLRYSGTRARDTVRDYDHENPSAALLCLLHVAAAEAVCSARARRILCTGRILLNALTRVAGRLRRETRRDPPGINPGGMSSPRALPFRSPGRFIIIIYIFFYSSLLFVSAARNGLDRLCARVYFRIRHTGGA